MKINIDQIAKQRSVKISYFESTTSTNTLALEGEYRHADLLIANHQSGGRGQRGHSWESDRGENLMFSLVIEPHWLNAQEQFVLSKMVSLALIDTLETYGIEGRIKWTNDIYVEGRKAAGILIENEVVGDRVVRSVLGVGLNVNQRSFSRDLPNPTSIALELERLYGRLPSEDLCSVSPKNRGRGLGVFEVYAGGEARALDMGTIQDHSCEVRAMANQGLDMGVYGTQVDCMEGLDRRAGFDRVDIMNSDTDLDRMAILDRFLSAFWCRYSAVSDQRTEALDDDYHARLHLLNTPHRYRLPSGNAFIGIIRSVGSSGELVVEREDGSMCGYLFGEIAF